MSSPLTVESVTQFVLENPEGFLAVLRGRFPRGMHLSREGALTEAGVAQKIGSLADLGQMARAPKTFQVEVRGTLIELEVRGLNGVESAECDKIDAGVMPPRAFRVEQGKKIMEQDYNFRDPDYLAQRDKAYRLKRAAVISKGLVGIEVPGETLEDKATFLDTNFPPNVPEAIHQAILALTSATLDKASFI